MGELVIMAAGFAAILPLPPENGSPIDVMAHYWRNTVWLKRLERMMK